MRIRQRKKQLQKIAEDESMAKLVDENLKLAGKARPDSAGSLPSTRPISR